MASTSGFVGNYTAPKCVYNMCTKWYSFDTEDMCSALRMYIVLLSSLGRLEATSN